MAWAMTQQHSHCCEPGLHLSTYACGVSLLTTAVPYVCSAVTATCARQHARSGQLTTHAKHASEPHLHQQLILTAAPNHPIFQTQQTCLFTPACCRLSHPHPAAATIVIFCICFSRQGYCCCLTGCSEQKAVLLPCPQSRPRQLVLPQHVS